MNKNIKLKITIVCSILFLIIAILGLGGIEYLFFVAPKRMNSSTVILHPLGCSMIRRAGIPARPLENGCSLDAYVDHGYPGLLFIINTDLSGTERIVTIPSTELISAIKKQSIGVQEPPIFLPHNPVRQQ